jgi:hypothetical protein
LRTAQVSVLVFLLLAPPAADLMAAEPEETKADETSSKQEEEGEDADEEYQSLGRPAMPGVDMDLLYPTEGVSGQAQMGTSFSQIGEDYFVVLNLSMVLAGPNWSIAPRVPLRLRVLDEEPKSDEIIRSEDWDEVSDFLRLVAFAEYRTDDDSFYVRFGEFTGASVGHSTMISRYYNTLDIDHYQAGLVSQLDLGIAGGEVLLDNVLDPELVVGRPFVRPLSWLGTLPAMFQGLKLGVTVGADFKAPVELQRDDSGGFASDDARAPVVLSADPIPLLGFDIELPVLMLDSFQFVPYFDLNAIDTEGIGIHFGSFLTFRFSSLAELRVRVEYRLAGAGYDPGYVNAHYEKERLSYRDDMTKLSWLRKSLGKSRTGVLIESELRLLGILRVLAVFSHDEGGAGLPASNDLVARLLVPDIGPVSISGFFAKLGFEEAEDLLDPVGAVVVGTVRWSITDYFYVEGRLTNEWWLAPESATYETSLNFDVGAGFQLDI